MTQRVADEVAWELLRDEWELLLAVGSGPSDARSVYERLRRGGASEELAGEAEIEARLALLADHGLIEEAGAGWSLVPAVHQRQEGMASYLRGLVLERVDVDGAPPLGARARFDLAGPPRVRGLIEQADEVLFPAVVDAASGPEGPEAERFLSVFVATADCPAASGSSTARVLRVLRSAALARSRGEHHDATKVWVAEMVVDPEVAIDIAARMDDFLVSSAQAKGSLYEAGGAMGAAAFAVWPVRPTALPPRLRTKVRS